MTDALALFGHPIAIANEHGDGHRMTAGLLFGPVAVIDAHPAFMERGNGERLFQIVHVATGHLVTMPHADLDVVMEAAERIRNIPEIRAVQTYCAMPEDEYRALMRRVMDLASPLTICTGTHAAITAERSA